MLRIYCCFVVLQLFLNQTAWSAELLKNVKIVGVMQSSDSRSVELLYAGIDSRCKLANEKRVVFTTAHNTGPALERISDLAIAAIETGRLVQVHGSTSNDCAAANDLTIGIVD